MLELFGFAWVTITFTCCVAAVSTRRSVLRWLKARTDRKRLDDTVEIVRRPMRRLATYAALVVLAVPAGVLAGGGALPGPSGGAFAGGTVPNATTFASPVVFTGDNAGGVGAVRIRTGDEDTQLVLCEAGLNASPEVCSVVQHYNSAAGVNSSLLFSSNLYLDSTGAPQRMNTSFGAGYIQTVSSSTNNSNGTYFGVYATTGALSAYDSYLSTGVASATNVHGVGGTVTNDFRGPILNGGSATCNGILAGNLCINDDIAVYSANGLITTQATNSTAATGLVFYTSGSVNSGAVFYGNASVSDADFAGKVVMRGVGYPLSMQRTDAVAAGTTVFEVMDNTTATGAVLLTVDGDGNMFLNTAATRTKGTITLAAGTGTATVSSGCTPTCSDTTAVNAVQCSVSGTTLTANGTGTDVISYHCF